MKAKKLYAVVSIGPNNASFPQDSIYSSENAAVQDFLSIARDNGEGEGEWGVVEFTSLKRLRFVLQPEITDMNPERVLNGPRYPKKKPEPI